MTAWRRSYRGPWVKLDRTWDHGEENRRLHQAADTAGKANPSPPVGPALGQRGLNIMNFVKEFNAVTQNMEPGMPVPVVITAFADRSFTFITKTPPNTYFLKKAAGITKAARPRARVPPSAGSPRPSCGRSPSRR